MFWFQVVTNAMGFPHQDKICSEPFLVFGIWPFVVKLHDITIPCPWVHRCSYTVGPPIQAMDDLVISCSLCCCFPTTKIFIKKMNAISFGNLQNWTQRHLGSNIIRCWCTYFSIDSIYTLRWVLRKKKILAQSIFPHLRRFRAVGCDDSGFVAS